MYHAGSAVHKTHKDNLEETHMNTSNTKRMRFAALGMGLALLALPTATLGADVIDEPATNQSSATAMPLEVRIPLIPGFNDAHVHVVEGGVQLDNVDLRGACLCAHRRTT